MSTTLLIMRHGKADSESGGGGDHGRLLAPRGQKDARRMGAYLTSIGMPPQLVLTSSAARALGSAQLAAAAGKWSCTIEALDALYEATSQDVVELLRGVAPDVATLLVVGHEPTMSALVSSLIGGGTVRMATSAVACIAFADPGWAAIASASGELQWLVTPRLLEE